MKHEIPVANLGPRGVPMAEAVQACVHCGFCLPTCPTYQVMGEEMDSPRGRIVLMKSVLEKHLPLEQAAPHLDACLGCLACETACPSGVQYRDLISPFRAFAETYRKRSVWERKRRKLLLDLLPDPGRFRLAAQLGRLARPFARMLPAPVRVMLDLLPARIPQRVYYRRNYKPEGTSRARVALLTGCVQQVLAPQINQATIDVLLSQGVEVFVPPDQGCCGALGWHTGDGDQASACARRNLDEFPEDIDAILTNAAGCGSCLHEYPLILLGTEREQEARAFAAKCMDVSVFLVKLGYSSPTTQGAPAQVRVAIQDACHLLHGQQVQSAPRQLLESMPGVTTCEIADPEICCGSAGTYNIDHPATAAELGRRKAESIAASGAEWVVSGNIGCLLQLRKHLAEVAPHVRAVHLMEFIALAQRCGLDSAAAANV